MQLHSVGSLTGAGMSKTASLGIWGGWNGWAAHSNWVVTLAYTVAQESKERKTKLLGFYCLSLCHFHHIQLVRASLKVIQDSRGREIASPRHRTASVYKDGSSLLEIIFGNSLLQTTRGKEGSLDGEPGFRPSRHSLWRLPGLLVPQFPPL